MEAKRGPSSGEKAGNANVLPATSSDESSSSTKKSTNQRSANLEAAQAASKETTPSLFFDRPDDPKNNADKVDCGSLFSDEKTNDHEDHEKLDESVEQNETAEDREVVEIPLTNEQELQVVEEYTKDRLEVVGAELAAAEKNSADAVIAQADKVLLEHIAQAVHERTSGQVTSSDEILDVASVKAEEALHMTHEVADEGSPHEMTEAERDDLIDSILHGPEESEAPAVETYMLDDESESEATTVATDESEPAMPIPAVSSGMRGGPTGPAPPEFASSESNDGHDDHTAYTHAVDGVSSGPDSIPALRPRPVVTRAETPAIQSEAQRRHDFNNGLLIGGVLGYVVGRHHGRKKAERASRPELAQHKKEVDVLQQKIIAREQHIRSLAANKVIAQQIETHTEIDSHKEQFGKATLTSKETPATPNPKLSAELAGAAAAAIGRPSATEAAAPKAVLTAAHAHNQPAEQVPAVAYVKAEAPAVMVSASNRAESRPKLSSKDVEQLPQKDLESVAETIPIKGQSLRKIYESGQIDKQGLRRVVAEYVRTGKVERLVQSEVAATQFRKRSPELTHGGGGFSALAQPVAILPVDDQHHEAQAVVAATIAEPQRTQSVVDAVTEKPTEKEKALNGRIVIAAAVIIAVAIILFASRRSL